MGLVCQLAASASRRCPLRLCDNVPDACIAVIHIRRIHHEQAPILPSCHQPCEQLDVDLLTHFAFEPGHFGKRDVIRQEV